MTGGPVDGLLTVVSPLKLIAAGAPPTRHWTLDRLQEELNKDGVPIRRSQIRRLLKAEHVEWQKPRTWLESDDPDFAEERGASSSSTPTRQRAAP
jgi:transposase